MTENKRNKKDFIDDCGVLFVKYPIDYHKYFTYMDINYFYQNVYIYSYNGTGSNTETSFS